MLAKEIGLPILLVTLITTSFASWANHEVGNGGDAVKVGSSYYSLDLFESGVQEKPYFRPGVTVDPYVLSAINAALDPSLFPNVELSRKLSELHVDDPIFTDILIQAMKIYTWRIVNGPLKDVNDSDDMVVNPPSGLVQAAIRRFETITISGDIWYAMDNENRSALVLHEIFYALLKPQFKGLDSNGREKFAQSSEVARRAVGFLFSRDFEPSIKGWQWFRNQASVKEHINESPGAFVSFRLMSNGDLPNGMRLVEGDHYLLSVQSVKNFKIEATQLIFSLNFNETNIAKYCSHQSPYEDADLVVQIVPIRSEITNVVRYQDRLGKPQTGFYDNQYVSYPSAFPKETDGGILMSEQDCVKTLKAFAPGVPLSK
jgi:hypothetical protein